MEKKVLAFLAVSSLFSGWILGQQSVVQVKTLTLSGRVVMPDGSPPATQVPVEFVCNSRVIQVTDTRKEGSFHFSLGEERRPSDLSAATQGPDSLEVYDRGLGGVRAGGGLRTVGDGRVDLTNCEIRLTPKPQWRSEKIALGIQSIFDTDVGTIVLHVEDEVKGTTVSVTTLEAPRPALDAFEKAKKELDKKKPNYKKAGERLEQAVALYPSYAEAWNLLAEARIGLSDPERARTALERSVAADPNYVLPYITLAAMELEKFRYEQALVYTAKLVELDPRGSQGRYYHGLANYSLQRFAEASESFQVIDENQDGERFPASYLMQGDILARQGRIPESASKLRRYLEFGQHTAQMGDQILRQLRDWEEKGLIEKQ